MKRWVVCSLVISAVLGGAPVARADHLFGIAGGTPPRLVAFESGPAPLTFTRDMPLSGFAGSAETVVGLDASPRDGALYALTRDGSETGRLYVVDPDTGALTLVGPLAAPLPAGAYGVDFVPQNAFLTVVSDAGDLNMRVNPANAAVFPNTDISPASVALSAITFINNDNDIGTSTAEYAFDSGGGRWGRIMMPVGGVFTPIATVPFTSADPARVGLDTAPSGTTWATHAVAGAQNLYSVDVASGTHTLVGALPDPLLGLTAAHVNIFGVETRFITAGEGTLEARVQVIRRNPRGSVSVDYFVTPGTAHAGDDYTSSGSGSLAFGPGEVAKTLVIPLVGDHDEEIDESFTVGLVLPAGADASLMETPRTDVTIVDDDEAPADPAPSPPPPPPPPPPPLVVLAPDPGPAPLTEPAPPVPGHCVNLRLGSATDDVLAGTPSGDVLKGLDGDDALRGDTGEDCLLGGPGDDWISGGPGPDLLGGQAGDDLLLGGDDADVVSVGGGTNRVKAGDGDDVVNARNGRRDVIDCGAGKDTVRADRRDRLMGCERRR